MRVHIAQALLNSESDLGLRAMGFFSVTAACRYQMLALRRTEPDQRLWGSLGERWGWKKGLLLLPNILVLPQADCA